MSICEAIEPIMAKMRYGLIHGGIVTKELSSDKALSALNISMTTNTDKLNVDALTFPLVKYSHGLFEKSIPPKLFTWNDSLGHDGHSDQFESCFHVTWV